MFKPYKAIIRQHLYEEFYPTAHYSNIFFTYVFFIFFLWKEDIRVVCSGIELLVKVLPDDGLIWPKQGADIFIY
jgi:hypothetical protein